MAKRSTFVVGVEAAKAVALWAQEMGLPAGNMWEPPMVWNVVNATKRAGNTPKALALVCATYRVQLGLR